MSVAQGLDDRRLTGSLRPREMEGYTGRFCSCNPRDGHPRYGQPRDSFGRRRTRRTFGRTAHLLADETLMLKTA